MVVPRSAIQIAKDDEFTLFAVTTFKKHSAEFLHKCREQKWTPRQYKYVEGGKEEEQRELDRVAREEKKVWGEALRLGRTGWSESVMVWAHVLTLRVFVETVLRYGLPLEFVCALVQVDETREIRQTQAFPSMLTYIIMPDHAEAVQECQESARLGILIPGWKRFRSGQEGQDHQGRCGPDVRDGGCWSWIRRRQRVHGLRVLRNRVSLMPAFPPGRGEGGRGLPNHRFLFRRRSHVS